MKRVMRINPDDNTATVLNDIEAGETIGLATQPIGKGYHVHTHNVESALLPGAKEVK